MSSYDQILVYILSTFLAIFLVLAIIVLVLVIKLMQQIRELANRAEHLADNAEKVGEFFANAGGPLALMKVVANIVKHATNHKSKKG
jgi:predicted PurR-regulated permease PerM